MSNSKPCLVSQIVVKNGIHYPVPLDQDPDQWIKDNPERGVNFAAMSEDEIANPWKQKEQRPARYEPTKGALEDGYLR